jgi:hypothetical protein
MPQDLKSKGSSKKDRRPESGVLARKVIASSTNIGNAAELPDFDEVECILAQYLGLVSTNPSKDAKALQEVITQMMGPRSLRTTSEDSSAVARRSNKQRVSKTAKEKRMVRDDLKPNTNAGVLTKRRPRSTKLTALLNAVLDQPEKWMATPSLQLGGRRPAELVGTNEEVKIFDILNAVDQGLF